MGRFPFGIAFGWYPVAWSFEIEAGAVEKRRYFDRELIVFRGDSVKYMFSMRSVPIWGHISVSGERSSEIRSAAPFTAGDFLATASASRFPTRSAFPGMLGRTPIRHASRLAWPGPGITRSAPSRGLNRWRFPNTIPRTGPRNGRTTRG